MTTSPLVPSNCNNNRVQIMRIIVPSLKAQIYSSLISLSCSESSRVLPHSFNCNTATSGRRSLKPIRFAAPISYLSLSPGTWHVARGSVGKFDDYLHLRPPVSSSPCYAMATQPSRAAQNTNKDDCCFTSGLLAVLYPQLYCVLIALTNLSPQ